MTLNSTGLGIGIASPAYKLDVSGIVRIGGSTNPALRLETGTNTGFLDYNNTRLSLHAGSLPIDFVAGNTVKMTLDASGNLLVGVASANANGGVLQLKSGITFPATQVAASDANTLDDYEEGTWTPVVADATTGGNVGTYANNGSTYTKIGRQVSVQTYISGINTTGMTGANTFRIRGLPFTSARSCIGNFFTYRVGRNASTVSSSAGIDDAASNVYFSLHTTNSATTDLRILVSDIVSGTSEFIVSITYFV
jgi:hypothetical protein